MAEVVRRETVCSRQRSIQEGEILRRIMAFDVLNARGLYILMDPLARAAYRGTTSSTEVYEYMRLAARGEQKRPSDVSVQLDQGKLLMDFIWVSLQPLVHDRVLDCFTQCEITGWCSYPITLTDKRGTTVHGYHGLGVTGRCNSMFLDAEHSDLVYVEYPKALAPKYRGLHVTRESWDGSDMFTSADRRTAQVVVTDKVRNALSLCKINNVELIPLSEVDVDTLDHPIIPYSDEKKGNDRIH